MRYRGDKWSNNRSRVHARSVEAKNCRSDRRGMGTKHKQTTLFVVNYSWHETNKIYEGHEQSSENYISKLHLGLNISMTINEVLIDAFVVFFCLHGPFEGSSFTKLLLAGGYESQTFELKRILPSQANLEKWTKVFFSSMKFYLNISCISWQLIVKESINVC